MPTTEQIVWHDPRTRIWGFHIHQELPAKDFPTALAIQKRCARYLEAHDIDVDASEAFAPGYGPHLDYMWELRIENTRFSLLEKMGLAISYMTVHRHGLSAYIHPLMHDTTLTAEAALASEGRHNQNNALWFSQRVPQNQTFFTEPPRDADKRLLDTRTPRVLPKATTAELRAHGEASLQRQGTQGLTAIYGFHIHLDFLPAQEDLALAVFDHFVTYLLREELRPSSTRLYRPGENGPHVQGGWEVKFEQQDDTILQRIGLAIAWLMCNRQGLSIFMHPVTWRPGDVEEELRAHADYAFFLGDLPDLDLSFFSSQLSSR